MFPLFSLANDVIIAVVGGWLSLKDLSNLDVAITSKKNRDILIYTRSTISVSETEENREYVHYELI